MAYGDLLYKKIKSVLMMIIIIKSDGSNIQSARRSYSKVFIKYLNCIQTQSLHHSVALINYEFGRGIWFPGYKYAMLA